MTKSISVGELRQNPTQAINEVSESKETYDITRRGRTVARIVPIADSVAIDSVSGLSEAMMEDAAVSAPKPRPRHKGVSPKDVRNSTLYRRNQSSVSKQKLLDLFNEGRDRSGTVGE